MICTAAALVLVLAAPVDEVVARVGPDPITQSQLKEREKATRARAGDPRFELLLEDLINDALLAQDGLKTGLARDPAVVAAVATERARLAGEAMVDKEIAGAVKVTDEQIKEAYHSSGDTVRFNAIVLASEEAAAAALQRLRGGATLASEATKSLDPAAAAKGGDSCIKMRGQLEPALAKAVFSAPLRGYSGPVKLELGFAVVQVVTRELADPAGMVARRAELRTYLERQLKTQYRQHYVTQLRTEKKIVLDEAFLRSTETRLTATPAEQERVIASVGNRPVRYREVLTALVATLGGKEGSHYSGLSVKTEFAWSVIDRALIETAALARGFGADPAVEAPLRRFERDEVSRAAARRLRAGVKAPSEDEIEAWYAEHPTEFVIPAQRSCSHLVVRERSHAEKLRDRLQKGEPFDELARSYSLDEGSSAVGGFIGVVNSDRLAAFEKTEPQLARALRDTRPNEVSAPTASKLGWHLVRCGAPTPAARMPLAKVREPIAVRVRTEREIKSVFSHLEILRAATTISRDTAALSRLTR